VTATNKLLRPIGHLPLAGEELINSEAGSFGHIARGSDGGIGEWGF